MVVSSAKRIDVQLIKTETNFQIAIMLSVTGWWMFSAQKQKCDGISWGEGEDEKVKGSVYMMKRDRPFYLRKVLNLWSGVKVKQSIHMESPQASSTHVLRSSYQANLCLKPPLAGSFSLLGENKGPMILITRQDWAQMWGRLFSAPKHFYSHINSVCLFDFSRNQQQINETLMIHR